MIMIKTIKYYLLLGSSFLVFGSVKAQSEKELFQTANSYYKNKQYDRAEHFYLQGIMHNKNNVNACFNLGNTYFHLKKYPEAILYYEKGGKLQPDNKYIIQNLAITNNLLFSKIEFSKEFFVTKYSKNFFNSKSSDQWSHWMMFCLWLGVAMLCLYFYNKNKLVLKTGILLLIFFFLFAWLTYSRYQQENIEQFAISFGENTQLHKTPVTASKAIDSIQAGTKVKLTDKDADWVKIELPNGKTGWIENKKLEGI